MTSVEMEKFCGLDKESKNFLIAANEKYQFSARALHRILKVARTIADLQSKALISFQDVAEALQYRIAE